MKAQQELVERKPEGSARVLLRVVERHPEAVFEAVVGSLRKQQQPLNKVAPLE